MSLPIALLFDTQTSKLFCHLHPSSPFSISTPLTLSFSPKPLSFSPQTLTFSTSSGSSSNLFSPQYQYQQQEFNPNVEEEEEEHVIGDCVLFEEGIFEDPYLQQTFDSSAPNFSKKKKCSFKVEVEPEDLVPDKWKDIQAEINITKKEKRMMARETEFRYRVEKRKQELVPISGVKADDYVSYRSAKLLPSNSMVVHNTRVEKKGIGEWREAGRSSSSRVAPPDPRLAVYGGTLDDISEFFNRKRYDPESTKNNQGVGRRRKLLTREEKVLLNKRIPDLCSATSDKWQPLHSLTASGEFYLVDALLKHNVDINIQDKDGLTALHKAVISKKQAIFSYLLRESANPFVRDRDGATLMHYAVYTASSPMIKILLLYNVDINLQDNDGWTPLHLAVQTRRTDIVRLLLIKGADKTVKNLDGLTPLHICLYSGQDTRTYELIKLLKLLPKPR